ncbi:MAG: AAA family ATPase [Alphaproteobacteria bacterium]|nr:AAA family ATPase [Alphaproteobacteria bacterium]
MSAAPLSLTLIESPEIEDGVVHLDNADQRALTVVEGDIIRVDGARSAYLKIRPALVGDHNQRIAKVSLLTAHNLGLQSGQSLQLYHEHVAPPYAERITLAALDDIDRIHILARIKALASFCHGRVVDSDDSIRIPALGRFPLLAKVKAVQPQGPVQITRSTSFVVETGLNLSETLLLGGMRDAYKTCAMLVEKGLKKKDPHIRRRILLCGPSGLGKARLTARLAQDFEVQHHVIDCLQILEHAQEGKESKLSTLLVDLSRLGPTLLVLDHMQALSARQDVSAGMLRARLQVNNLLEEVWSYPNVMVFGITSDSFEELAQDDHIAPELFDFILPIDNLTRWERLEVLNIAARKIELAKDVDLSLIAALMPGASARDLTKLVRSAADLSFGPRVTALDLREAMRSCPVPSSPAIMCDVPDVNWNDVAGLEDIKHLMLETLNWSLFQNDKFMAAGVKPPRSVLMSGGVGTGKTTLARALASRMAANFIEISCPLLHAQHGRSGACYLQKAFALARRKPPCIIFLDDMDALFEVLFTPELVEPPEQPVATQLIAELDALSALTGVVVIAATNRPDRLTPEILRPGRFDYALTLPMPDKSARKKILNIHARKLLLEADVDFDRLAQNTQGMSGAEISGLCNRVGMMALRRTLAENAGPGTMPVVTADLFDQALRGRKG